MKQKTADLQGQALDWAVAKAESRVIIQFLGGGILVNGRTELGVELDVEQGFNYMWHPSSSWSQAGPIIEREGIELSRDMGVYPILPDGSLGVKLVHKWMANIECRWQYGPTQLVAAMRAFVASRLGDEIEIPEELI
jgi:hypothetical protein